MKLPSNVVISSRKLTEYLLTPRAEDDKSGFLARADYTLANVDCLLTDLLKMAALEAAFLESTEYGDKYEIRGTLRGTNGRTLRVVTIWMIESATRETKFITLFPDKS